jgi:hypothetical protein
LKSLRCCNQKAISIKNQDAFANAIGFCILISAPGQKKRKTQKLNE